MYTSLSVYIYIYTRIYVHTYICICQGMFILFQFPSWRHIGKKVCASLCAVCMHICMPFPEALRYHYAPASARVCAVASTRSLVSLAPSDIFQPFRDIYTASALLMAHQMRFPKSTDMHCAYARSSPRPALAGL